MIVGCVRDYSSLANGSLLSHLQKRLVTSPFTDSFVDTKSFYGRFLSWVRNEDNMRWQRILSQALDVSIPVSDLDGWQRGKLCRLKVEFSQDKPLVDMSFGRPELRPGSGVEEHVDIPWTQDVDLLSEMSLLDMVDATNIDKGIFASVYGFDDDGSVQDYVRYFYSKVAHHDSREGKDDFSLAMSFASEREQQVREVIEKGDNEQGQEMLSRVAHGLSEQVAGLELGSSLLFFGGCSNTSGVAINGLRGVVGEMLPESLFANFVRDGDIDAMTAEFSKQLGDFVEGSVDSRISAEYLSAARQVFEHGGVGALPERYRRWIPGFVKWLVPKVLKMSFKDELFNSLPEGHIREMVDNIYQGIADNGVDEGVRQVFTEQMAVLQQGFDKNFHRVIKGVSSSLPGVANQVLSSFGFDELEQPMWFEVTKEDSGKCTLRVFSAGSGIDQHHSSYVDGVSHYNFPLTYSGLSAEQLNQEFFAKMVSFRVWPQWRKDFMFSARDVHDALRTFLGKSSSSDEYTVTKESVSDRWGLAENFVLQSIGVTDQGQRNKIHLKVRQEALVEMWSIGRDDPATADLLAEAARDLMAEALKLEGSVNESFCRRCYATGWDVLRQLDATTTNREKVLSKPFTAALGMALKGMGDGYLDTLRECLIAACGSDMEETVDNIIAEVSQGLDLDSLSAPEEPAFSWNVRNVMKEIMGWIEDHPWTIIYTVATTLFQIAVLGATPAGVGIYLLNSLWTRYHAQLLAMVLPRSLMLKYYSFLHVIRKAVLSAFIRVVAKLFLSQEMIEKVNMKARSLQQAVSRRGQLSLGLTDYTPPKRKVVLRRMVYPCEISQSSDSTRRSTFSYERFDTAASLESLLRERLNEIYCLQASHEMRKALLLARDTVNMLPIADIRRDYDYWDRITGIGDIILTLEVLYEVAGENWKVSDLTKNRDELLRRFYTMLGNCHRAMTEQFFDDLRHCPRRVFSNIVDGLVSGEIGLDAFEMAKREQDLSSHNHISGECEADIRYALGELLNAEGDLRGEIFLEHVCTITQALDYSITDISVKEMLCGSASDVECYETFREPTLHDLRTTGTISRRFTVCIPEDLIRFCVKPYSSTAALRRPPEVDHCFASLMLLRDVFSDNLALLTSTEELECQLARCSIEAILLTRFEFYRRNITEMPLYGEVRGSLEDMRLRVSEMPKLIKRFNTIVEAGFGNPLSMVRFSDRWRMAPSSTPVTSDEITPVLRECYRLCGLEGTDSLERFSLVARTFECLDVPCRGNSPYWDAVKAEDIQQCMVDIVSLLGFLGGIHITKDLLPKRFITVCHAYVILDYLARRCPESRLEGFDVYGWHLVEMFQQRNFLLQDSLDHQRLLAICDYCRVDLTRHYSAKDIDDMRRRSLFGLAIDNKGGWIEYKKTRPLAEQRYYESLMECPDIQRRMEIAGITAESSRFDRFMAVACDASILSSDDLDPEEFERRLAIVDEIGSGERRLGSILPYPVYLLRIASYFANSATIDTGILLSKNDRGLVLDDLHFRPAGKIWDIPATMTYGLLGNRVGLKLYSGTKPVNVRFSFCLSNSVLSPSLWGDSINYSPAVLSDVDVSNGRGLRVVGDFLSGSSAPQHEILARESTLGSRLWQMTYAEGSDQIVQALAFFEDNMELLDSRCCPSGDHFGVFRCLLLQGGLLSHQLRMTPDFGERIGQFFCKALDFCKKRKDIKACLSLVYLGLSVEEQCVSVLPGVVDYFPNFAAELQGDLLSLAKGSVYFTKLYVLTAILHKNCRGVPSRAAIKDMAKATFNLKNFVDVNQVMQEQIQLSLGRWSDIVFTRLEEDVILRREIINEIMVEEGFDEGLVSKAIWMGSFPVYSWEGFTVDFEKGKITDSNAAFEDVLAKELPRYLKSVLKGKKCELRHIDIDKYLIVGTDITVEIDDTSDDLKGVRAYKVIEGVRCQFFSKGDLEIDALSSIDSVTHFWLEEDHEGVRKLYLMGDDDLIEVVALRVDEEGYFEVVERKDRFGVQILEEVDFDSSVHGLHLLNWFCPKSQIKVMVDPLNPDMVHSVVAAGLKFVVHDGKAYSDGLAAGFYIRANQYLPSLASFPKYILLENDVGELKVVVLAENFNTGFIAPVMKGFQTLPDIPLVDSSLSTLLQQFTALSSQGQHYVYEIDSVGDGEVVFNSEDTSAIAFLSAYYLALRKYDLAYQYIDLLENKGKLEAFSDDAIALIDRISLFSLVDMTPKTSTLMLRLMAIKEENSLLHSPVSKQREQTPLDRNINALMWLLTQYHYMKYRSEGRTGLTDGQELLILQGVSRKSKRMLKWGFRNSIPQLGNMMSLVGLDVLAGNMLMMPSLMARYRELRSQRGEEINITENIVAMAIGAPIPNEGSKVEQAFRKTTGWVDRAAGFVDRGKRVAGDACRKAGSTVIPCQRDPSGGFINILMGYGTNPLFCDIMQIIGSKESQPAELLTKYSWSDVFDVAPTEEAEYKNYCSGMHLVGDTGMALPLTVAETHPCSFTTYFIDYYRLAMDSMPEGIGSDEGFKGKVERFKRLLSLMRGTYDKRTTLIIECLRVIVNTNSKQRKAFPSCSDISQAVWDLHEGDVDSKSRESFDRLHKSCQDALKPMLYKDLVVEGLKTSSGWGAPIALTAIGGTSVATYLGAPTLLLYGAMVSSSLWYGQYGVRMLHKSYSLFSERLGSNLRQKELGEVSLPTRISLSTDVQEMLSERDGCLGGLLVGIRDRFLVTTEEDPAPVVEYTDAFDITDETSIRSGFVKMRQSLVDYYERPKMPVKRFALVDDCDVEEFRYSLTALQHHSSSSLKNRHNEIVAFANQSRSLEEQLSWDDLLHLFLQGNFNETRLSLVQQHDLDIVMYDYLIESTRYQQVTRALSLFEQLAAVDVDDEERSLVIAMLGNELSASRKYSVDLESARLLRAFLVFEYQTGYMLWPGQVKQVSRVLLAGDSEKRLVWQLLMGMGKTDVGIPIVDFVAADGAKLVINMWPAPLAKTNTSDVSAKVRRVYQQTSYAIGCRRDSKVSVSRLLTLSRVLQSTQMSSGVFNMMKEDAQALELKFVEMVYGYHLSSLGQRRKMDMAERVKAVRYIQGYMTVLGKIKAQSLFNMDEAHDTLDRRKELNFPWGLGLSIPKEYIAMASEVMKALMSIDVTGIRENRQTYLSSESYDINVKRPIAEIFSRNSMFGISREDREAFVQYVCDMKQAMPECLAANPHQSEIALLRGILNKLLSRALTKEVFVDFGPSPDPTVEYAIPYAGNGNPQKSTIRNPYEAIVKTLLMMIHIGLNDTQCERLVEWLEKEARREHDRFATDIDETKAANLFREFTGGYELSELSTTDHKTLYDILRHNDGAVLLYASHFICPEIKYYQGNIRSNAQNFASMCAGFVSDTGTPYNTGVYPLGTRVIQDEGTLGETIDMLMEKCSREDAVQVVASSNPDDLLDEMLAKFFVTGSKAASIIDIAALFCGLDSITVARRMLSHIKRNSLPFQGVAFYDKSGALMMLESVDSDPIPFLSSHIPPEKRAAYFDQPRTFAANIELGDDAEGVVTVGKRTTLEAGLAQGVWRMRKLKRKKQTLTMVMREETRQSIRGDGNIPNIKDIIEFTQANEELAAREENYLAAKDQINDCLRRLVIDKMLAAKSISELMKFFGCFVDVFVDDTEINPLALYGQKEEETPADDLLEEHKQIVQDRVTGCSLFSREEKRQFILQMEAVGGGDYPSLVSSVEDDLDRTQEVDQHQHQEVDQNRALELDQDMDMENRMQQLARRARPVKPMEWNPLLEFGTTDWIVTKKPRCTTTTEVLKQDVSWLVSMVWSRSEPTPLGCGVPLYCVKDVFASSPEKILRDVAPYFDDHVICTNNFIPFVVGGLLESVVDPGSAQQRPVSNLLVVHDAAKEQWFVIALSAADTVTWKRKLAEDHTVHPNIRMVVYNVTLSRITAASSSSISHEELLASKPLALAEVQLGFLNGTTKYSSRQKTMMEEWLSHCDIIQMRTAFEYIHSERGTFPYRGSDIEIIFDSLE